MVAFASANEGSDFSEEQCYKQLRYQNNLF